MEYNFREIEKKWQKKWVENKTYQVTEDKDKRKFYVLNMFPYPSGAGLHVGHPLGYIASDIYARYKRLKGFNVLNPMGYDAYGLPAEQYAIQTGQHPAITTVNNINRYREQLDKIGFSFDWSREIRTCDPDYYKWTQWAFQQMFASYYDNARQQARPITELEQAFAQHGTEGLDAACTEELNFTAAEWNAKSEKERQQVLMNYRIAYLGETMVNWCPQLGTVLANDEVVDGVSERGGFPVVQKKMKQWCLRVSAYAQRLLDGLETIDWSDSLKETQRNWIGRSEGTEVQFKVKDSDLEFTIFTTRADTMFGVTFMVLAPESELVPQVTTPAQKAEVDAYLERTKKRTERDRISDRSVTGVFTGSYAVNPFTGTEVPIWVSDYVLAGYGTGAIMAVPAHDSRDYAFARHFNLPIIPLIEGADVSQESFDAKEGIVCNSPVPGTQREGAASLVLNGLTVKEAIAAAYPQTEYQRCIVHQVRNTLKYVADKERKPFANDLKTIYQAPSEEQALEALERVTEKWSIKYPNSMKSWKQNWDAISPIFKFSIEVRKVIYTTNAIESLNSTYRKLNRQRSVFPSDTALLKALYLATFEATKKWTIPIRNWGQVYGELSIMYEGRLPE